MRVQIWHDEMERYDRTGRLDEGPCWCPECVALELSADNDPEEDNR